MKWNIIVSTVVLGLGLCAPSYGFDLLDRMLGAGGCGCETQCCEPAGCCDKGPSCCDVGPSCCDSAPCCQKSCHRRGGLFGGHHHRGNGCCAKDACGCEAPSCCDKAPSCCEPACCEPACCEPACCQPSCKKRCRPCLLERIFGCRKSCCDSGCNACDSCTVSCGCDAGCDAGCTMGGAGGGKGAPAPAMEGSEMAPMPPAPVVDPSAYLPAKRRVVHASTTLVR